MIRVVIQTDAPPLGKRVAEIVQEALAAAGYQTLSGRTYQGNPFGGGLSVEIEIEDLRGQPAE